MSVKTETINTYNTSAEALAKKFDDQGARTDDINFVFSYVGAKNPKVLEIGCGNGRDAKEICQHTDTYQGIDISENLLAIARKNLLDKEFILADIEEYDFPTGLDIVFAFASLIHVPKESFKKIMAKLFSAMTPNSVLFVSLKHSERYSQVTKTDEFGTRTYWHYSQADIEELASDFSVIHISIQDIRGQVWMDILFQKKIKS